MNILVTGAAGFIGFHTALRLLEAGHAVVGIDNLNTYYDRSLKLSRTKILKKYPNYTFLKVDICETKKTEKILKKHAITHICQLAAQAGVRYSIENPFAYIHSNIQGMISILEAARRQNVKNIVYASSSSVYGDAPKTPFSEKDLIVPISLYAVTKKADEEITTIYQKLYGLHCIGLRFFTVYGPWGRPDMALFGFTQKILKNQPIDVYNNGDMQRDFTYIDDIVQGVVAALEKVSNKSHEVYNLGNNTPVKLLDFITTLEKTIGKEARKNFKPRQPGDVLTTYADITKAQKDLGYIPKTELAEGIGNFYQWYKEYYKIK